MYSQEKKIYQYLFFKKNNVEHFHYTHYIRFIS